MLRTPCSFSTKSLCSWTILNIQRCPGTLPLQRAIKPLKSTTRLCTRIMSTKGFLVGELMSAKAVGAIALGGHRGMGENLWDEATDMVYPPCRENTVRSFLSAAAAGASFVEFDVQVTSDGVPVIWHDDDIIYGDPEGPYKPRVCDVTWREFNNLVTRSGASSGAGAWCSGLLREFKGRTSHERIPGLRPWVCTEDDGLPTLEDLFQQLPTSLTFNIEVKMLDLAHAEVTPPEEVDRMLTPILSTVKRCIAREAMSGQQPRHIVYSSFDPDVCTALLARQSRYPVFYLTVGGCHGHIFADPRRNSMRPAYDIAATNGMAGVAVPAALVVDVPSTVEDASRHGHAGGGPLRVMTWGLINSDAAAIRRQAELGVHAAIVDDAAAVLPALLLGSAKLGGQGPALLPAGCTMQGQAAALLHTSSMEHHVAAIA